MARRARTRTKDAIKFFLNFLVLQRLNDQRRRKVKQWFELRFWHNRYRQVTDDPAKLAHERAHYEYFFTIFFDLTNEDYRNKRVLDIGCGPMGSLEWADMAQQRIGLDPLADCYRKLGTASHSMAYVSALAEAIPFPDMHFDIVTSFNSLDHVDDVNQTIQEIKRVTASDGVVLLITEIGHMPTFTEPHRLDRSVLQKFGPEFAPKDVRLFGVRTDHRLYSSLREKIPPVDGRPALLCAKLGAIGPPSDHDNSS